MAEILAVAARVEVIAVVAFVAADLLAAVVVPLAVLVRAVVALAEVGEG